MADTPEKEARRTRCTHWTVVGASLRAARLIAGGLSPTQLSELLDVTVSTISEIETGRREMPLDLLRRLPPPVQRALLPMIRGWHENEIAALDSLLDEGSCVIDLGRPGPASLVPGGIVTVHDPDEAEQAHERLIIKLAGSPSPAAGASLREEKDLLPAGEKD